MIALPKAISVIQGVCFYQYYQPVCIVRMYCSLHTLCLEIHSSLTDASTPLKIKEQTGRTYERAYSKDLMVYVLYSTVLYCTALHCPVLCCTVPHATQVSEPVRSPARTCRLPLPTGCSRA